MPLNAEKETEEQLGYVARAPDIEVATELAMAAQMESPVEPMATYCPIALAAAWQLASNPISDAAADATRVAMNTRVNDRMALGEAL
jgi:hypothetical protein